jgi:transporter family-2 protein
MSRIVGHRLFPAILTILLGTLIAVQSRVNGQLAVHTGTGLLPAWWTMTTGLMVLGIVGLAHAPSRRSAGRVLPAVRDGSLPRWALLGGAAGATFLITQSIVVPLVGVAVFSVGTVAGQTSGSLLVDRLGFSASGVVHITANRVIASILAVVAVAVAISDRLTTATGTIAFALFAVLAGALVAPQQAANGRVAVQARSPYAGALVNFIGGTVLLSAAMIVAVAVVNLPINDPWGAPWWAYVGGLLGLSVIAGAAWAVPLLGVLVFSLLSVMGQLTGALLLDVLAPTQGTSVGWHLVAGLCLTGVAILISARRPMGRRGRARASGA